MAARGTRISRFKRSPPGFKNDCTVTSLGMSCAAAGLEGARRAVTARLTTGMALRCGMAEGVNRTVYITPEKRTEDAAYFVLAAGPTRRSAKQLLLGFPNQLLGIQQMFRPVGLRRPPGG